MPDPATQRHWATRSGFWWPPYPPALHTKRSRQLVRATPGSLARISGDTWRRKPPPPAPPVWRRARAGRGGCCIS